MNDRRIESVPSFPFGAFLFGLICIASLAAWAVLGNVHFLVFALAPGLLAVALWFFRPRPITFDITDDGLHIDSPTMDIPFDSIESIYLNGRPQDFNASKLKPGVLTILHERGQLDIPAALSVPIVELYRLLGAVVPPHGADSVSAELSTHLQNEETIFGLERVHAFSARSSKRFRPSRLRAHVCLCLMMICGIVWAVCGGTFLAPPRDVSPWLPLGIMCAVFSGLFWILVAAGSVKYGVNAKLRNSCMIISPSGVALMQGDLKGQLRWDELKDIRFRSKGRSFVVSNESNLNLVRGIQLIVPGATIDIFDVYNRPLPLIHGLLQRYWKGGESRADMSGNEVDNG